MGKDSPTPTPPQQPDPVVTARAQGQMNQNTATTQQLLNMTNQDTPYGSLSYDQTGSNSFTGADGQTYTVPQFTARQTLSPSQQRLFDINNETQGNLATIGRDASSRIGGLLSTPVNLNNEAVESRLFDLGSRRLTPQFERDDASLRNKLINSGLRPGSSAWGTEMTRLGENKNDALNQLLLSGRQQSISEILAERNQPINEITALMSGSQVSQPNFTNTPQTSVGGVDYAGMVRDNYNTQNQNYQAQLQRDSQQSNAAMGGMFGLGSTLASGAMRYGLPLLMAGSDRRLKENIRKVGALDNGLPVYVFNYKGNPLPIIGLMADDVEHVHPEAVGVRSDGMKMVDYARAVEA